MARLGQRHKLLAARVAREAWRKSEGDKEVFEQLVKDDARVKSIDPALIILFIRLAMAIFEYFKNRQAVSLESAESDEALILGAVRHYGDK
jgi:hypothetical protein